MKVTIILSSLVVALFPATAIAQGCPLQDSYCCDASVKGSGPAMDGKDVGINCVRGGFDCGFGGQVTGCCARLAPLGGARGTGIDCTFN
ncbi:hypothetical protein FA13DRAFT_854814 [Coprinellus micaceus]|uniref:Hydrophobin n=1 Tax=Coprinellus micaceus TaxID=71717 RepID=A0A4Y7T1C0_COPMI|nr:hypothetical protein FA13DRAFT_207661 [Coprinellus micaceus]TEB27738.1 hypothetical protein FA13DRAFT_854814 [Coprinellus micaceus]